MAGDKKRVLILGVGAAGISTALELQKVSPSIPGLDVTVLDQRDYHHPLPFKKAKGGRIVVNQYLESPGVARDLRARGLCLFVAREWFGTLSPDPAGSYATWPGLCQEYCPRHAK